MPTYGQHRQAMKTDYMAMSISYNVMDIQTHLLPGFWLSVLLLVVLSEALGVLLSLRTRSNPAGAKKLPLKLLRRDKAWTWTTDVRIAASWLSLDVLDWSDILH